MTSNNLEVFKGSVFPKTILAADMIATANDEALECLRPALGLMGDVQVSRYGAIGFTLLDAAPENRVMTWNPESDYHGQEGSDTNIDVEAGLYPADFARDTRVDGTRFGFKVVRYAILPKPLLDLLDTNKWVGPAVIKQALEDGVVPADYVESPVHPSNAILVPQRHVGHDSEQPQRDYRGKMLVLEGILKQLGEDIDISDTPVWDSRSYFGAVFPDNHRTYTSFHPWVYLGMVQKGYELGVRHMLDNIDELMGQFVDKDGTQLARLQDSFARDERYLPVSRVSLSAEVAVEPVRNDQEQ